MEKIKIKYLAEVNPVEKNGDWIDLRAAEDVQLQRGELKKIRLGVAIQLPKGCEAIVASRSSTPKKFGILQANGIGIIDNAYCGDNDEWGFLAYAIMDTEIRKNDRIAQFRILRNMEPVEFEIVQRMGNKDRGGFGSTGHD